LTIYNKNITLINVYLHRGNIMTRLTDKQKQIIEATIEIISEKSIQGLTIKNLSKKIGLTEGAIYRHFDSKIEILLTILYSFQNEAKNLLGNYCNSERPALEMIEEIFQHHFEYFVARPAVTSVIFSESIFQNDSRLIKEVFRLLEMHEKALTCIIVKGQKTKEINANIEAKEFVRIIIGSIRYMVTKWRLLKFEFDLLEEGRLMLKAIKELLKS